jgi:hypothetical protein
MPLEATERLATKEERFSGAATMVVKERIKLANPAPNATKDTANETTCRPKEPSVGDDGCPAGWDIRYRTTAGRSKATDTGASALCEIAVSNPWGAELPTGSAVVDAVGEGVDVVAECIAEEMPLGLGPATCSTQLSKNCTETPSPLASTPVCSFPAPNPDHFPPEDVTESW